MSKRFAGLLALCTVLIFTRLALISSIIFLLVIANILVRQKSKASSFIWVYLFFFSFIAIAYQLAWIFNVRIPTTLILILLAVLTWLLSFIIHPKLKKSTNKKIGWSAVIAALVVCIFVNLPVLLNLSSVSVLRYSAKTSDDINHINLVEADRAIEGYAYTATAQNTKLIERGFIGYPQGWHINGAFIESLIVKLAGSDSISTRLLSYLIFKSMWIFVAVFMLCELFTTISRTFFKPLTNRQQIIAAASIAILSLVLLVSLYGYGFQNFIASIALMCASIILGCNYINSTKPHVKQRSIDGLAVLAASSALVWVMPGVVLLFFAFCLSIADLAHRQKFFGRQSLVLAAATFVVASQIYITQRVNTGQGAASINLGGSVPPISILGSVMLLLITIIFVLRFATRKMWLTSILFLAASEFLAIAAYQQASIGQQRYYAYKLAFLSSIIIATILLAAIFNSYKRNNDLLKSTGLILVIVALPIILQLNLRKSAYPLKNSTSIKPAGAQILLAQPKSNQNAVILTQDKEESFLATKLWSAVQPYSSPERQQLLSEMNLKLGQ